MKSRIFLYFMALAMIALFAVFAGAQSPLPAGSSSKNDSLPPPADIQPNFIAALNAMPVITPTDSTAHGKCIVKQFNPYVLDITCEYSGLSSDLTGAHVHLGKTGQNGFLFYTLSTAGGTSGTFNGRLFLPYGPPAPWYLSQKRLYVDMHSVNFPDGEIRGQVKPFTIDADIDGDGRADAFVFRPSDVSSYVLCSTNSHVFINKFEGDAWDQDMFLADFDGDGIADMATTHHEWIAPGNITTTYVRSSDNILQQVQWGNELYGDIPAYGNYDSDGKMDMAVFRPSDGIWYILQSSDNQPRYDYWGKTGDRPCPGDYDKDGITDLCVVRDEGGQLAWYIRRSTDYQFSKTLWGLSTDTIFPANPVDIDADGANDILIARTENEQQVYYALLSSDNSMFVLRWGLASDRVKIGDFDGDGKTDFAAVRTIDKQLVWFINQSSDGQMRVIYWGLMDDK